MSQQTIATPRMTVAEPLLRQPRVQRERVASVSHHGSSSLLRVLAAFGVICGHVATRSIFNTPDPADPQWQFAVYFGVFCLWTLPCFIMISGEATAAHGAQSFSLPKWARRMRRIVLRTLAVSAVFVLVSALILQNIGEIGWISAALGGSPFNHLWYMYFAVALYALAPWLIRLPALISPRVFWAGLLLLFAASAYGTLPGQPALWKIPFALCMVSYFLVGAQMHQWQKPREAEIWFWVAAFVVAGVTASYVGVNLVAEYGIFPAFVFAGSLGGPAALVMAMAAYRLIRFLPVPRLAAKLAPATFLIYIVHPLWLLFFERFAFSETWHGNMIGLPLMSVAVFAASAATALLLRWFKYHGTMSLPALRF